MGLSWSKKGLFCDNSKVKDQSARLFFKKPFLSVWSYFTST